MPRPRVSSAIVALVAVAACRPARYEPVAPQARVSVRSDSAQAFGAGIVAKAADGTRVVVGLDRRVWLAVFSATPGQAALAHSRRANAGQVNLRVPWSSRATVSSARPASAGDQGEARSPEQVAECRRQAMPGGRERYPGQAADMVQRCSRRAAVTPATPTTRVVVAAPEGDFSLVVVVASGVPFDPDRLAQARREWAARRLEGPVRDLPWEVGMLAHAATGPAGWQAWAVLR